MGSGRMGSSSQRDAEALESEHRRLEFLLSATSAVTYSCAPTPPFAATFVSDSVETLLGWEATRFIEERGFWANRIHPDEKARVLEGLSRIVQEGRHIHEYRFLHADGRYRWVRDDLSLVRDERGEPREIVGCMVDVTSRVEAEIEGRKSAENFYALIEALPIGIFVYRDYRIVYANPALVALLGASSTDTVVGRSPLDFAHDNIKEMVRERIARITNPANPSRSPRIETNMRRDDGTLVSCEIESLRIVFDGQPSVLVIARDLTEHYEMVGRLAAADRLASIGMLAAGVAHEINNPLTFVVTNLAAMAEEIRDHAHPHEGGARRGEFDTLLQDAIDGAARVRVVVRDLLRLSRPADDDPRDVDVRNVLDSCIKITQSETRYRAQVVRHFEPVPSIRANESRLGQVFMNLIVNAAQSIAPGHVQENEIGIATYERDGRVVVEVQDTGSGIRSENRDQIFEPFFTTKSSGSGTGLGLSVAKRILDAMGGTIDFEDREGGGTIFRVTLPAASPPVALPQPIDTTEASRPAVRPRLLVVDDEAAMGTTLRFLLESDFEVVTVTSVRDAIARIESTPRFDVVLSDLVLPGLDGMAFYDRLRDLDPRLLDRIVFMTGGAFTETARAFLEGSKFPTIDKPFDPDELRRVLLRVVGAV